MALEDKLVLEQVNAGLVALEHVEPEEQVYILAFHDGEGTAQYGISDGDLGRVYVAEDASRADALGNARVSFVEKSHDAACFCALDGHYGRLGAGIDKCFDGMSVDYCVDVEHRHATIHCR